MVRKERADYLDEDLDKHDFVWLDRVADFLNHFFVDDMQLQRAFSIEDNAVAANYGNKKTNGLKGRWLMIDLLRLGFDAAI